MATAMFLGVTGTAQATFVNNNGTGQVLLYPYYTTQAADDGNAYVTAISVVNTSTLPVYTKVRIREGENSAEVLDFNLFLSPSDVWTGALVRTDTGARLTTNDNSCTVPEIPAGGIALRNTVYSTLVPDGGDTGEDRTREGHIEILLLGVMTDNVFPYSATLTGQINAITHVAGTPPGCDAIRAAIAAAQQNALTHVILRAPTPTENMLAGGASIINVALGKLFTYDATALADVLTGALSTVLGNEIPNFTSTGISAISDRMDYVFSRAGGFGGAPVVTTDIWALTVDAISAVLMRSNVMNEYVLDAGTLSGTDWVITFPTKRYYTPVQTAAVKVAGGNLNSFAEQASLTTDALTAVGYVGAGLGREPFQRDYWNGSCDDITISFWDREELVNSGPTPGLDFSPLPPVTPTVAQLCHEVNVVSFGDTQVLGSQIGGTQVSIDVGSRENGWASIRFLQDDPLTAGTTAQVREPRLTNGTTVYTGLPVIGFAVQDFTNQAAAAGVLAVYGGSFTHKYRSLIVTP